VADFLYVVINVENNLKQVVQFSLNIQQITELQRGSEAKLSTYGKTLHPFHVTERNFHNLQSSTFEPSVLTQGYTNPGQINILQRVFSIVTAVLSPDM
jgi:hypothetical protein